MPAYAQFSSYNKDFHTEAFALGIKGDRSVRFHNAVQLKCTHDQGQGRYTYTVAEGNAVYLFGGKRALVEEFDDFKLKHGDFVLEPPDNCYWLSVYHGKITVKLKPKRILMISSHRKTSGPPSAISDRRLRIPVYERQIAASGDSNAGYYTGLDLANLERIVRGIQDRD